MSEDTAQWLRTSVELLEDKIRETIVFRDHLAAKDARIAHLQAGIRAAIATLRQWPPGYHPPTQTLAQLEALDPDMTKMSMTDLTEEYARIGTALYAMPMDDKGIISVDYHVVAKRHIERRREIRAEMERRQYAEDYQC